MKQVVGNMGKLHGVNLEKVRLCNLKTKQALSINSSQGKAQQSGGAGLVTNQLPLSPANQQILSKQQSRATDRNSANALIASSFANQHASGRRHLSQAQAYRVLRDQNCGGALSRSAQPRNPNPPRRHLPQNRSVASRQQLGPSTRSRIMGHGAFGEVYMDREERERVEMETRQRKQRLQMSKNLIDILFQTEKDKERERLKREKDKLRGLHPNLSKDLTDRRDSSRTSRASRASGNQTSEALQQQFPRNASKGVLNLLAGPNSRAQSRASVGTGIGQ